jgi:hypothetical protein
MSRDLEHALDEVHAALLDGAFAQLGAMSDQITHLLNTASDLTKAELDAVQAKAARNAALLRAAMQGVRAADRRLGELREAARGHKTYGPKGQRATIADAVGTLRQRV